MKKTIVFGGVGLAVFLVGGQLVTQSAYEQNIDGQINYFKQVLANRDITLSHQPGERSLFNASDKVTVTMGKDHSALELFNPQGAFTFTAENNCTLLPFYLSCGARFTPVSSTAKKIADAYPIDYDAGWSANILMSSLQSYLVTKQSTITDFDGKLTLLPLTMQAESDIDLSYFETKINWKGLTLTGSSTGTDVTLGRMQFTADNERTEHDFYTGEFDADITDIRIATGVSTMLPTEVRIDKLRASGELEQEDDDFYEYEYEFAIDNISTGSSENVISKVKADISIDQLSVEFFKTLHTADLQSSESGLDKALQAFGQNKHRIEIEELGFFFNEEPVSMNADLNLAQHTPADYDRLGQKLNGQATISISEVLAKSNPVISLVLAEQIKKKVVILNEGKYQADLTIKDGQITANDETLYQL